MDYEFQAKPFEPKDGTKYVLIHITDVTLHTAKKRGTESVSRKIKDALDNGSSGRIVIPIKGAQDPNNKPTILEMLRNDTDFVKFFKEEEAKGYKVLMRFPSDGIPLLGGKDSQEFINSTNGQRMIRGIAKKNPSV